MNELLIFAKAPRPGLVKTRLAATLGKDQACRAYQELLTAISRQLSSLQRVTVCYSPADAVPDLRPFFPPDWNFRLQRGADLGLRLQHAIATSLELGAASVAVIGSDCPYVTCRDIQRAFVSLQHSDVVFGPAHDGGYWLVAVNSPHPQLFTGLDWGTPSVLNQSLARAEALKLKVSLLRELCDIDTESDWRAFRDAQP